MTHPTAGSGNGQAGGASTGPGGGAGTGPGRELQTFSFGDLPVRTITIGGEPWFVAADVCAVLGIGRPQDSTRYLDDDEKGRCLLDTPSGEQHVLTVNEPGLYSLILRSRKPEAKAFKRWVTHEVLPALRRSGRYEVARLGDPLDEIELANQRVVQAVAIARAERDRADRAETELAEAAPKAHTLDTLMTANGDYDVAHAAQILSRDPVIALGRNRLFAALAEHGWIRRDQVTGRWRAYQRAVDAGWLSELPQHHYDRETGDLVLDPPQIRVTVKGLHRLHHVLGGLQPLRLHEQLALTGPSQSPAGRREPGAAHVDVSPPPAT